MEKGDISNVPAVRLVWVFETTLGYFADDKDRKRRDRALRFKRWETAAECWALDAVASAAFWDYSYRKQFSCDIVTYVHPNEAPFIKAMLEEQQYPFGLFEVTTVHEMSRGLTNNPSVYAVFDGDQSRRFTYGHKTRSTLVL